MNFKKLTYPQKVTYSGLALVAMGFGVEVAGFSIPGHMHYAGIIIGVVFVYMGWRFQMTYLKEEANLRERDIERGGKGDRTLMRQK